MATRNEQGRRHTVDQSSTPGPLDRDRHRHSVYMTGVLARALTAQLEEIAERDQTAAGWWFTRPERPVQR